MLQGEREIASYNKSLGKFRLEGIRRALRGVPQIEVTFSIDANGIVNVSAKDLGTGSRQQITISGSSNMSQREIDQAIRDAERYAAEDKAKKEAQKERDRAENLLAQAKRVQKKLKSPDQEKLQAAIQRLEEALRQDRMEPLRQGSAEMEMLLRFAGQYVDNSVETNDDGSFDV